MPAWKVGSGEVTNTVLLKRMAQTGKPVLLSSGMSSLEQLDRAVEVIRAEGAPFMLFQCTSKYPCPPEDLGLEGMAQLRERYGVPVGFSDHSGVIHAGIAAATLGASALEVHIAMSRDCFGPDVSSSLIPGEFAQMVEGVRFVERAAEGSYDRESMAAGMAEMQTMFGRSVVAARALPAGTVLTAEDLTVKKPGGGIPPDGLEALVGCTLVEGLDIDDLVTREVVEG